MPPQVSYELANWNGELSNFQPQHIPSRPPSLPRRTKRPVIAVEQREKSIEQRSMPPSHARHTPPGSHPTKAQSTQTKRHPKPPCLDSSDLENNEKANMTVERMLLSEDFASSDEMSERAESTGVSLPPPVQLFSAASNIVQTQLGNIYGHPPSPERFLRIHNPIPHAIQFKSSVRPAISSGHDDSDHHAHASTYFVQTRNSVSSSKDLGKDQSVAEPIDASENNSQSSPRTLIMFDQMHRSPFSHPSQTSSIYTSLQTDRDTFEVPETPEGSIISLPASPEGSPKRHNFVPAVETLFYDIECRSNRSVSVPLRDRSTAESTLVESVIKFPETNTPKIFASRSFTPSRSIIDIIPESPLSSLTSLSSPEAPHRLAKKRAVPLHRVYIDVPSFPSDRKKEDFHPMHTHIIPRDSSPPPTPRKQTAKRKREIPVGAINSMHSDKNRSTSVPSTSKRRKLSSSIPEMQLDSLGEFGWDPLQSYFVHTTTPITDPWCERVENYLVDPVRLHRILLPTFRYLGASLLGVSPADDNVITPSPLYPVHAKGKEKESTTFELPRPFQTRPDSPDSANTIVVPGHSELLLESPIQPPKPSFNVLSRVSEGLHDLQVYGSSPSPSPSPKAARVTSTASYDPAQFPSSSRLTQTNLSENDNWSIRTLTHEQISPGRGSTSSALRSEHTMDTYAPMSNTTSGLYGSLPQERPLSFTETHTHSHRMLSNDDLAMSSVLRGRDAFFGDVSMDPDALNMQGDMDLEMRGNIYFPDNQQDLAMIAGWNQSLYEDPMAAAISPHTDHSFLCGGTIDPSLLGGPSLTPRSPSPDPRTLPSTPHRHTSHARPPRTSSLQPSIHPEDAGRPSTLGKGEEKGIPREMDNETDKPTGKGKGKGRAKDVGVRARQIIALTPSINKVASTLAQDHILTGKRDRKLSTRAIEAYVSGKKLAEVDLDLGDDIEDVENISQAASTLMVSDPGESTMHDSDNDDEDSGEVSRRRMRSKSKASAGSYSERQARIHQLAAEPQFCHQCRNKNRFEKMRCTVIKDNNIPCGLRFCEKCFAFRYPDMEFNPYFTVFVCPKCANYCNCTSCCAHRGERYISTREHRVDINGKPCHFEIFKKGPQKSTRVSGNSRESSQTVKERPRRGGAHPPPNVPLAPSMILPEGSKWGTIYSTSNCQPVGIAIVVDEQNQRVAFESVASAPTVRSKRQRMLVGQVRPGWQYADPLEDPTSAEQCLAEESVNTVGLGRAQVSRFYVGLKEALFSSAYLSWEELSCWHGPLTPPPEDEDMNGNSFESPARSLDHGDTQFHPDDVPFIIAQAFYVYNNRTGTNS